MAVDPKTRARLLQAENERLAKDADQARNFELAKFHYQIANAEGKDLTRLVQPVKPRGDTAKTEARKALLAGLRDAIQPATNEQFAAELREKKHRKQILNTGQKNRLKTIIRY